MHLPEDLLTAIDAFEQAGFISRSKAIQIGSHRFIGTVRLLLWMMDLQLLSPHFCQGRPVKSAFRLT